MNNATEIENSILFVDDEEIIRKSFVRELRMEGLAATAVADGSEAIAALEQKSYAVVITDLMMPGIGGMEVLKAVKQRSPLTGVIIFTGFGDLQSAIDALRNGADDFIRKPCETEEMVHRIKNCLNKHRLMRQRIRAEQALQESRDLNLAILNSLSAEIAVLAPDGVIIAVNDSWRRFALDNGIKARASVEVGANYLSVCRNAATMDESNLALKSLQGIQAVLTGDQPSFTMEYPCHGPDEERWFRMHVTPLNLVCRQGAVVAHVNITDSKKLEADLDACRQRCP